VSVDIFSNPDEADAFVGKITLSQPPGKKCYLKGLIKDTENGETSSKAQFIADLPNGVPF